MTIDLEQALGLAVQVSILIAAVAGFVVWLKRWVKSQVADPVKGLAEQVGPNGNGNQDTTRHLIEGIHNQLDDLAGRAEENRGIAEKSLGIATEALTIGRHLADRLDRHMAEEHGPDTGR